MSTAKRRLHAVLARLGLIRWVYRYVEWRGSRNAPSEPAPESVDGLALPSPYLMTLVAGSPDWRFFLSLGETAARTLAELVDRNGGDFRTARRVLDFGCGCGRVARHLPRLTNAELFGVDLNPRLIAWCRANLPGAYEVNALEPPIQAPEEGFDVTYLLSVFTHLRRETQLAWLRELRRVAAPGGFVLISFHDEDHPGLLKSGSTPEALEREGFLVFNDAVEGSNYLRVFQTRATMRALCEPMFEVREIVASQETQIGHAVAVLRA